MSYDPSEDAVQAPYKAYAALPKITGLQSLPADPDALIPAAEAPSYVGIAKQTMSRWRHQGDPPRYVRLGRRIFYRAGDLREWIRGQVRENTIRP
jgi:predicted DNA-binding transcriptional regulator AlpA